MQFSDEPYYKLVYDNVKLPFLFRLYKKSFIVNSFSKSLALAGERIGYIAVNPEIPELELILESLIFCNRTLGYVNAPALFQRQLPTLWMRILMLKAINKGGI